MTDIKKQPPLKQVMLTGLLTVSLGGGSASVFAQPAFIDSVLVFDQQQGGGGNPTVECAEYDAVPLAKSDPPPTDDPPVDLTGTLNSGTWSSTEPVDVMIVKGATGRDGVIYDPAVTSGSYSNAGLPLNNGGQLPDISHITFCVKEVVPEAKGVCVLDFDKPAIYNPYPLYFNGDGWFDHGSNLEPSPTGTVTRFLSCYQNQAKQWCQDQIGEHLIPPNATVTSAHWYDVDTCNELRAAGVLPSEVKLLATDVNLTASKNAEGGVDLTLTTESEEDTAKLMILRGKNRENNGTEIETTCIFDVGGSPYTCTDDTAGDTYRAAEIEYDGSFIVYGKVKPKK